MKILIAVSAPPFIKGNRIAMKGDDGLYYIGSVTRVAAGKVHVLFDDGVKFSFADTARGIKRLPDNTKLRKRPIDLATLKGMLDKAKSKPARQTKPVTPPKVEEREPEFKAPRTKQEAMGFMVEHWHNYNKKYFNGQLALPVFYVMRNLGSTKFRGLGRWIPSKRELALSPRAFTSEKAFHTTFVHEMCHQAVSEIDRVNESNINRGHGPVWSRWMRHCGLDPQQFANTDDYRTDEENAELDRRIGLVKGAQSNYPQATPKSMMPAQHLDVITGQMHKGIILGPADSSGKRWHFIESPTGTMFKTVTKVTLFELDPAEVHIYTQPEWLEHAKWMHNAILVMKTRKRMERIQKQLR